MKYYPYIFTLFLVGCSTNNHSNHYRDMIRDSYMDGCTSEMRRIYDNRPDLLKLSKLKCAIKLEEYENGKRN